MVNVVVLGFLRPTNSLGHTETGPRFKVSSERLEKPGIELTTLTARPRRLLLMVKNHIFFFLIQHEATTIARGL